MTSNIEGIKPAGRLIISKDKTYQMGNLRLLSGNLTKSDQEVAVLLLETYFPGCESIQTDTEVESRNKTAAIED
jgi:hypothetical protein